MNKFVMSVIVSLVVFSWVSLAEPTLKGRDLVVLKSNGATIAVDLGGGGIADFHFNDQNLNPLSWNHPEEGDKNPRQMGHFLCLGRWGPASQAEIKNGMTPHGESSVVQWNVTKQPVTANGKVTAELFCNLPIGGLTCNRTISLDMNNAVFTVTEEMTNVNKLGRLFNVVQHPSIGPPFLDESVVVDTEVVKGLTQNGRMPNPEDLVIYWPEFEWNGNQIDYRRLSSDPNPAVVSFILDESNEYSWVTATNSSQELLIGYVWKTAEYPWLSLWRDVRGGKPTARGLEFGTTGLHQPYPVLIEKGYIFGKRLYDYLDAGETVTKSYTGFLARVPKDYKGVEDVLFKYGVIVLREHGGDSSRDIEVRIR